MLLVNVAFNNDIVWFHIKMNDVLVVDQSSLTNAILARDIDTVESMLSSGADPNARRVGKETPVWSSANGRHIKPERQDPNSCHELYPLDLAMTSRSACRPIVELSLIHGADPNSRYPRTTIAHRVLERRGSDPKMTERQVEYHSIHNMQRGITIGKNQV